MMRLPTIKRFPMKKFLIFFLTLFFLTFGGIYFWSKSVTGKVFVPRTKTAVNANSPSPKETPRPATVAEFLDKNIPFNILLLGYGGGKHEGTYLTDSLIVARLDPSTKKVFLISIPRDVWVKIPIEGENTMYTKINAAYTYGIDDRKYPNKLPQYKGLAGGGNLSKYAVSQVVGLPIDYFAAIDFAGFTNTIDTLGGVEINVNPAFEDKEYPVEGKEDDLCGMEEDAIASLSAQVATGSAEINDVFPCRYEDLKFEKGLQHMNGSTALKYVRSRHSLQDGSDFGRSQRQRNLLVAVKQKVFSGGFFTKAIPFINSLGDDVRTDLTLDDVKVFVQNATTLHGYEVISLALTDKNYLQSTYSDDHQYILAPRGGISYWKGIHNWLTDTFNGKETFIPPSIRIENGTKNEGLAQKAGDRLKQYQLDVVNMGNSYNRSAVKNTAIMYAKNIDPKYLEILKKEFNLVDIPYQTPKYGFTYDLLITLGTDYLKNNP